MNNWARHPYIDYGLMIFHFTDDGVINLYFTQPFILLCVSKYDDIRAVAAKTLNH